MELHTGNNEENLMLCRVCQFPASNQIGDKASVLLDITPPSKVNEYSISDLEEASQELQESIVELGCSCKGDLALVHYACALKWFISKGCNQCEVCRFPASNIRLFEFMHVMDSFTKSWQRKIFEWYFPLPQRDISVDVEISQQQTPPTTSESNTTLGINGNGSRQQTPTRGSYRSASRKPIPTIANPSIHSRQQITRRGNPRNQGNPRSRERSVVHDERYQLYAFLLADPIVGAWVLILAVISMLCGDVS